MNDDLKGFEIALTDPEVRTLYYAVNEAITHWPGSPARPAEEQVRLKHLQNQLFRMVVEMSFEQS